MTAMKSTRKSDWIPSGPEASVKRIVRFLATTSAAVKAYDIVWSVAVVNVSRFVHVDGGVKTSTLTFSSEIAPSIVRV